MKLMIWPSFATPVRSKIGSLMAYGTGAAIHAKQFDAIGSNNGGMTRKKIFK